MDDRVTGPEKKEWSRRDSRKREDDRGEGSEERKQDANRTDGGYNRSKRERDIGFNMYSTI